MVIASIATSEERFDGLGGLSIFFRVWRPPASPQGVVVIVHGFNSHSGHYQWAAERLMAEGLAVYALDLRGRGKSEGERFFVQNFADYVADVASFVRLARSREGSLPLFLLGHSAGGVVACLYAVEHQAELTGLICESFAFKLPAPGFALSVLKGLSRIAPHLPVLRLKNEDFSREPRVVAAMKSDPLIAREVQPARTVAELIRADERLNADFPRMTLPLLILHGTADKAAKPSGSRLFHERAGSRDKTLKLYVGHFHDLLRDVDKEIVMAELCAWVHTRLGSRVTPKLSMPV